ncbi:MAG: DUF1702 family protein [Bacteroidia bacterium]
MSTENILAKLEKAKAVYESFSQLATEREELKVVLANLENTNPEFRSIAYEAVAMAIALKDLNKDNQLYNWRLFMEGPAILHIQQVHVGLGWALAKLNISPDTLTSIEYLMRPRVFDGYGYYEGLFRSRTAVKGKKLPAGLTDMTRVWYDQGLGRSIWFLSSGEPAKAKEIISGFDVERRPALWKGIGHAAGYIGGCDHETLHELASAAGNNITQLGIGAAMAARGRVHANFVTPDTELACQTWWGLSAKELASLSEELLPLTIAENIYDIWQKSLEKKFIDKQLVKR